MAFDLSHTFHVSHCLRVVSGFPFRSPSASSAVGVSSPAFRPAQERFTQDTQPHYIYSPREMTRWVRGIFEALRPLETLSVEGLVRVWAHEALRLFQDR